MTNTAVATADDLTLAFLAAADEMGADIQLRTFITFSGKSGTYKTKNDEGEEANMPASFKMALSLREVTHGYTAWLDKKKIDSMSFNLLAKPSLPPMEELSDAPFAGKELGKKDDRSGWSEFVNFTLQDMVTHRNYVLGFNSKSAVNTARQLIMKIVQQIRESGHDLTVMSPIIKFSTTHFMSKGGDKVSIPKMVIDSWTKFEVTATAPALEAPNPDAGKDSKFKTKAKAA